MSFAAGDVFGWPGPVAITRESIAGFAQVCGDANPVHLDDDAARRVGLPSSIGHAMLVMALMGRMLTEHFSTGEIRSFDSRFVAMIFPGDLLTFSGKVTSAAIEGRRRVLELDLLAANAAEQPVLTGHAVLGVS